MDTNNLCDYTVSKFLPAGGFKWINPKGFNLNKYASNSSKSRALEVDLEFAKELRELRSDYPIALDNIEIKEKLLSSYQLDC